MAQRHGVLEGDGGVVRDLAAQVVVSDVGGRYLQINTDVKS